MSGFHPDSADPDPVRRGRLPGSDEIAVEAVEGPLRGRLEPQPLGMNCQAFTTRAPSAILGESSRSRSGECDVGAAGVEPEIQCKMLPPKPIRDYTRERLLTCSLSRSTFSYREIASV